MSEVTGKILKGIGGFYYVNVADLVYECKARGVFRKDSLKPLVGDDVRMEILDEEGRLGNITEILPRRSSLIRPAVANVDQAMIIFALARPEPTLNLLDRFLVNMEKVGLPCVIVFNKEDLKETGEGEHLRKIYADAGYETCVISCKKEEGIDRVRELLQGRTTTVAGPSGVGKSSLINLLLGRTHMETGDVSDRIDRGKHTTRHSELLRLWDDTYIFDTPGFSSLDLPGISKEELWTYYPEFAQYEPNCRFAGCSHVNERDCGVREALAEGQIAPERYENYCLLYRELAQKTKW
jgi:ribosome biogenesis GTPase